MGKLLSIKDAASIWLVEAEDDGRSIPAASEQTKLKPRTGAIYSIIEIDTLKYRAQIDSHAVRKNVSMPAWMAQLADKRNINCSKILQDGLYAEFDKPYNQ